MKFFIKSYGCQMNSYDSQRMADSLISAGHEQVSTPDSAELFIFNTCSIRAKADDKLFSDLGRIKPFRDKLNAKVVVTGCVAQLRSDDLAKRMPWVDIILGPQDIQYLVEKLKDFKGDSPIISTNLGSECKFSQLSEHFFCRGVSEFVTIQEGCDNFCTYCVVPFTRGREFSRDVADILTEAKKLIALGVKEITLLGQNVNSYDGKKASGEKSNLSELLWKVAELPGLRRLRYTTSNPQDLGEDLAIAHRDIPILAPFLHLPVQAGSDEILRRMNRRYTSAQYLELVYMLREYRPDLAFSSDFIVGFPGETDNDFANTLNLVKKVQYSQAYSFKYSPRPRTAAATMPNQVPEKIKSERLTILQNLLNHQQNMFNKSFMGKTLEVLFTKNGRHTGQLVGKSEYFQAVTVNNATAKIGDMLKVKITDVVSHSVVGELV